MRPYRYVFVGRISKNTGFFEMSYLKYVLDNVIIKNFEIFEKRCLF